MSCSKSTSVQIWLFGYELSDTIIGMTKEKMVIITSKKKAEFLKPLTSSKGSENSEGTPQVTILIRSKEGNSDNFAKFFEIITENGKKLGNFSKESFEGNFYKEMRKELKSRDLETTDISGKLFWYILVSVQLNIGRLHVFSKMPSRVYVIVDQCVSWSFIF